MWRSRQKKELWYKNGLRFACQRCGKCCSGPSGVVEFTREEGERMASYLGMGFSEFLWRYCELEDERYFFKENPVESELGFDCVMLTRDPLTGTPGCLIHEVRPCQCRTWPFWPETLRSERAWRNAGNRCRGINSGPLHELSEIEACLAEELKEMET